MEMTETLYIRYTLSYLKELELFLQILDTADTYQRLLWGFMVEISRTRIQP